MGQRKTTLRGVIGFPRQIKKEADENNLNFIKLYLTFPLPSKFASNLPFSMPSATFQDYK